MANATITEKLIMLYVKAEDPNEVGVIWFSRNDDGSGVSARTGLNSIGGVIPGDVILSWSDVKRLVNELTKMVSAAGLPND